VDKILLENMDEEMLIACLRNILPLLLWRRGLGRGGRFNQTEWQVSGDEALS